MPLKLDPPIHPNEYLAIFNSITGERVLQDIQENGYLHDVMFQAGEDTNALLVREGARQLALYISEMVQTAVAHQYDEGQPQQGEVSDEVEEYIFGT